MGRFHDLRGEKYGRLTPYFPQKRNGRTYWFCHCDCGNEKIVSSGNLTSGQVKSCGCLQREKSSRAATERNTTHGKSETRLYKIYYGMLERCYNSKHTFFKRYGGRGIRVCDDWYDSFERFFDWAMTSGYADGLTIDRIDNDGNYEPSNCRWVPRNEQQRNRSTSHKVKIGGLELSLVEWSELLNISYNTVLARLRYGWSDFDALTKPVMRNREEQT